MMRPVPQECVLGGATAAADLYRCGNDWTGGKPENWTDIYYRYIYIYIPESSHIRYGI